MAQQSRSKQLKDDPSGSNTWNQDESLAMIAHEIRNTSQIILSWAELLCRRAPSDEAMLKGFEVIRRNGRLQARLLNQLLAISRKQRTDLWDDARSIALVPIMKDAIETMAPQALAKTIQLTSHIETPAASIIGDPVQLEEVFTNLLSNAIKFTPHGGHIEVRLRRSEGGVEITVSDSGQGISADFLPYVFERFRQERRTQTAQEGLGLGLAIARHLVEKHGGKIMALSPGKGQGATFKVCFPFAPAVVSGPSRTETKAPALSGQISGRAAD
ncbi:MAG TPA: HAMP domain-containing sensor histidine kinase [Blastocatellia bacterium]|nr:HAMP domain-containing sensor histidine kinase [Blastocatellia bacterium]